LGYKVVFGNKK